MKKILVIDDDKNILENTAEILTLSHYEVIAASNGKEGVEKALITKPDLILCDIMMPELDGYGVLHMMQKNPDLQDVPFIFITAKTDRDDIRKGMSMGADDYITKPFYATDLLNALEGRLKKSELLHHQAEGRKIDVGSTENLNAEKVIRSFLEGRHYDVYKRKQRIYNEGNHPVRLFYVQKGKVKIYKTNDEGKELIVHLASEGEFFGYTALLENTVYKENADALEEAFVVDLPKSEFEALIHSNNEVSQKFIRLLASDVAEKEEQLIRIAYNSLRKKVADALLSVCRNYKTGNEACLIGLSRENLAAVAATAPESLTRTLTDFKAEKLIDMVDGKIRIINKEKLLHLRN